VLPSYYGQEIVNDPNPNMAGSPSHLTEPLPPPEPLAVALEVELPLDDAEADADADADAELLPLAVAVAEEELVKNWKAMASPPLRARASERQVVVAKLLSMATLPSKTPFTTTIGPSGI
jgi:hypothetical protein